MPGFDTSNVAATVGQNPAPNAMQTISGLAGLQNQLNQNKMFPLLQQGQVLSNQTAQQGLQNTWAQNYQKVVSSVPPGSDPAAYTAAVASYAGRLYPQEYAASQAGNTDWVTLAKQAAIQSESPTAMEAQFGTINPVSTPQGTQFENVNRVTGQVAAPGGTGAFVANALSPADRNTKAYDYWDGTQMRTALQGDVADDRAAGKLLPGQAAPGGPIAAQPPPGYEVGADASSLQLQKALNQIPEDQALIAQAKNAHDLLNTPGVETGPGSGAINQWRDTAIRFLGDNAALIPGLDATKLNSANNDELHKDMARLSSALSQESGAPGSDFRLAQSITGNANIDMTNLPNDTVMALNGALLRYRQAGALAFQKSGQPGGDANFTKWLSTNFATQVDPRAFALDMMPAERRQSMIKAMSPTDYKKFMNGVGAATKLNFYQLSDIPGVSQ